MPAKAMMRMRPADLNMYAVGVCVACILCVMHVGCRPAPRGGGGLFQPIWMPPECMHADGMAATETDCTLCDVFNPDVQLCSFEFIRSSVHWTPPDRACLHAQSPEFVNVQVLWHHGVHIECQAQPLGQHVLLPKTCEESGMARTDVAMCTR